MIPQFLKSYCAETMVLEYDDFGPTKCTEFALPNTGNLKCAFLERRVCEKLYPHHTRTRYEFRLHTDPYLHWTAIIPDHVEQEQIDQVLKLGLARLWLAALGLEKI